MKFKQALFVLFLLCTVVADAQRKIQQLDEEKKDEDAKAAAYEGSSIWDNVRFGGNLGGGFGSNYSSFLVQPQAFYLINDNFMAGLGFTYFYWQHSVAFTNGATRSFSDHSYGPNFFARHRIFSSLFAQAEYNALNFKSYNGFGDEKRLWNHALFIGPGFFQEVGRGGAYFFVLYDILWKRDDSLDPNAFVRNVRLSPWDIRIGFFF